MPPSVVPDNPEVVGQRGNLFVPHRESRAQRIRQDDCRSVTSRTGGGLNNVVNCEPRTHAKPVCRARRKTLNAIKSQYIASPSSLSRPSDQSTNPDKTQHSAG